jgi:hypothetical protein
VLWHLPLPVVLQQAFLFKFGDVNKAVLLVLSWTYGYLLLPKIKMLLVGRVKKKKKKKKNPIHVPCCTLR